MRTGLEPATPGVTGLYSNQLNYRTSFVKGIRFSIADAKVRKIFCSPNFSWKILWKKLKNIMKSSLRHFLSVKIAIFERLFCCFVTMWNAAWQ